MKDLHPDIRDPYAYLFGRFHQPYNAWSDAGTYVLTAINQRLAEKFLGIFGKTYEVSPALMQRLHDFLLAGFHRYGETDDAAFEKFWISDFAPIARTHRALVKFMFTKQDDQSRTYMRWIVDVIRDKNYAKAMLMTIGEGYDWFNRPCEITEDDNFIEGVSHDWTLQEARWRQMKARSAMMTAHDVLIIGAGYVPELCEKYGGVLPKDQRIVACDMDSRIPRHELEQKYPNLDYRLCDALTLLGDYNNKESFDVITLPGVLSYNLDNFDEIFGLALYCLRPGGTLLFDLQLMHIGLIHYHLMIDWGVGDAKPMKLLKEKEAIQLVKQAAKLHQVPFEVSTSGKYQKTSALLFEISKPQ